MRCCRCSTVLDERLVCDTCSQFYSSERSPEDMRHWLLVCISREAERESIDWKAIPLALEVSEKYGIAHEEIDKAVRYHKWRHEEPLLELCAEDQLQLDRLRERGIVLHRCKTGPFRHGFFVSKSPDAGGNATAKLQERLEKSEARASVNSLKDLVIDEDASDASDAIEVLGGDSDAPHGWLFPNFEKWVFGIMQYCPGPGPGDFWNEHQNLTNAVDDVLDYYFGNPERMDAFSEYCRKAYAATNPDGHRIKVPDDHPNKQKWLDEKTGGAF